MSDLAPRNRDRDEGPLAPSGSPDERLGALLRATGRRPAVPSAGADRVRNVVHAHWRAETRHSAGRRRAWTAAALATAAIVLVSIGLGLRGLPGSAGSGEGAARVEVVDRAAWVRSAPDSGASPDLLRVGDPIAIGSELATEAGGRLAVRLASGHSVRLDSFTRVRILSNRRLALDRGAAYVDSSVGSGIASGSIEIRTPFGDLTDRGTQFEVRLAETSLIVRVREGTVAVDDGKADLEVLAGQELWLYGNGRSDRRDLATHGAVWDWIDGVTPMMEIEGRSLGDFLSWAARERGLTCAYSSAEQVAAVRSVRLNGSIGGMTIEEALSSVLPTCRMTHRIENGRLFVEAVAEAPGES